MSIQIQKTQYITINLTPKEFQLIDYIRNNFKYGKVILTIHAGQPEKLTIKEVEKRFDGEIKVDK